MNTMELFESMHEVSATMAEAARANDWERLATLERDMAAARTALTRRDADADTVDPASSDSELARKANLISAILENTLEVRQHVDPWMHSARKLLSEGARGRAIRAAYQR